MRLYIRFYESFRTRDAVEDQLDSEWKEKKKEEIKWSTTCPGTREPIPRTRRPMYTAGVPFKFIVFPHRTVAQQLSRDDVFSYFRCATWTRTAIASDKLKK